MTINERDGFKFFSVLKEPYGSLVFEKERVQECIDYMHSTGFSRITVRGDYGFCLEDLGFLNEIKQGYQLGVVGINGDDFSVVEGNRWIEQLMLSSDIKRFPLGSLPRLRKAYLGWNPALFERGLPNNLDVLHLHEVRSPVRDLSGFPHSASLSRLALINSRSIVSLSGIDRYPNLEYLEISYLTKLVDVSAIKCCGLESRLNFLLADHCKGVCEWEALGHLQALETLYIHNSSIKNLAFVPQMTELLHFRFVGTTVVDGNLEPLLESKTLRKVAFSNKKNFNLKEGAVVSILKSR